MMPSERALPTPPLASPTFSAPSPMRTHSAVKSNPHPYSIITSSTGLLSRGSSSGHNPTHSHHYTPVYPSSSRSPELNKGHKSSRSLNSVHESPTRSPRPLPVPPSFPSSPCSATSTTHHTTGNGTVSADEGYVSRRRSKRADTLPSFATANVAHPSAIFDDLPSNPKLWTPAQLSSYLMTALRTATSVGEYGHTPLPVPVAMDIATFMREEMVSGRTFLRMSEDDLERMGINTKWRRILLNASQTLRQNVLKGRIWGPEPSSTSGASSPPLPVHVFSSALSNSSSSSVDLSADESASYAQAPRARRGRSGRVRGMVETLERSGSFSSSSSLDGDGNDERANVSRWLQSERPLEEEPLEYPSSADRASMSETVPRGRHHVEEEPTMEALLASEGANAHDGGSWGARAWEQMDLAPGVTVKRIVHSEVGVLLEASEREAMPTIVSRGSGSGKGTAPRKSRVVTAIFSPTKSSPAELSVAGNQASEQLVNGAVTRQDGLRNDHLDMEPPVATGHADVEALEREVAATRALVEVFRHRLEAVEQKVADLEWLETEREKEREMILAAMEPQENRHVVASSDTGSQTDTVSEDAEDGDTALVREDANDHGTLLDRTSALLPAALNQLGVSNDMIPFTRGWTARPDNEDHDEPSSVSDLPSYVLLVGIGVCAVVFRVMMRKLSGRGAIAVLKS